MSDIAIRVVRELSNLQHASRYEVTVGPSHLEERTWPIWLQTTAASVRLPSLCPHLGLKFTRVSWR